MDSVCISVLLGPFLASPLSDAQLTQISTYIDILLRWNQKLNLTAVRDPKHVVTRHFGESIFAAQNLSLSPPRAPGLSDGARLLDLGSGAGFPGLPIKICASKLSVTLIESRHKKATFLREVIRALRLTHIDVFTGRAQDFPASSAPIVTLRAVERFDTALLAAARLLRTPGRLALLIGQSQVSRTASLLPRFIWRDPLPIPLSTTRVLLIGDSQDTGIPETKNLT
jgi:16S rRNA (guanine527-N7)-methyltransferase